MSSVIPPEAASWWVTLPNGGVRRIWVRKDGDVFHGRIELCTAAQDAARRRLADALSAGTPLDGETDAAARVDALVWSGAIRRELTTPNVSEAFTFLGGDDAALNALIAVDPSLGTGPQAQPAIRVTVRKKAPVGRKKRKAETHG